MVKNGKWFLILYTMSGKKRPPQQNAVKWTVYNTIQ